MQKYTRNFFKNLLKSTENLLENCLAGFVDTLLQYKINIKAEARFDRLYDLWSANGGEPIQFSSATAM